MQTLAQSLPFWRYSEWLMVGRIQLCHLEHVMWSQKHGEQSLSVFSGVTHYIHTPTLHPLSIIFPLLLPGLNRVAPHIQGSAPQIRSKCGDSRQWGLCSWECSGSPGWDLVKKTARESCMIVVILSWRQRRGSKSPAGNPWKSSSQSWNCEARTCSEHATNKVVLRGLGGTTCSAGWGRGEHGVKSAWAIKGLC